MEYYIAPENISKYLILPSTFDWQLVDQELGFKKIFSIFPKEKYLDLKTKHEDISRSLTKAAVHYAFVFSIPKLKVQITNYGLQEFSQDKMRASAWWDVRDLGLSLLKVADSCFSEAISIAAEDEILKSELDFFSKGVEIIRTPADFENIYSINSSPEVFQMLRPLLHTALQTKILTKINKDCFDIAVAIPELYNFMKRAIGFYALYYASLMPAFVFTQNAVVIQYEELPWQKSQILDPHVKLISGRNFLTLGDELIKIVLDYIKSNLELFPCYTTPDSEFLMQARDSGIYL